MLGKRPTIHSNPGESIMAAYRTAFGATLHPHTPWDEALRLFSHLRPITMASTFKNNQSELTTETANQNIRYGRWSVAAALSIIRFARFFQARLKRRRRLIRGDLIFARMSIAWYPLIAVAICLRCADTQIARYRGSLYIMIIENILW